MNTRYNAADIEVLSGLDPVKRRPGMYTDTTRPNHLAQEVVDNSIDEALAGHAKTIEVTLFADGSCEVSDDGRGMPVDIHPEEGVPGVELIHGRAEALPREAASSDFVSMGYALRHIDDVGAAFAEFFRVLRPGGRLLVLEISKPAGRVGTALLKTYMRAVVPTIARVVAHRRDTAQLWRYYWDTIEACIAPEQVLGSLRTAGFESVKRHVELGVFSEYTAVKPG